MDTFEALVSVFSAAIYFMTMGATYELLRSKPIEIEPRIMASIAWPITLPVMVGQWLVWRLK